jgi:hypothetical protein
LYVWFAIEQPIGIVPRLVFEWQTLNTSHEREDFQMATMERKLQIVDLHKEQLSKLNKMVGKASQAEFDKEQAVLSALEQEYTLITEKAVYRNTPDVIDLLTMHHFTTISHKANRENGVLTGFEFANKDVPVNLRAYCDELGYSLAWFYELQALNKRLTMKVGESLGFTPEQIAKIDGSYAMDRNAREIKLGETPTSNTQCVKHMQRVFDLLAPGAGKVNNYDLAFVMACYSKKGRAALKVACSKHNALMGILLDVFHRVVTGSVYDVDYKMVKEKSATVSEPKAEKKPAKKASKKKGNAADVQAEAPAA